MFNTHEISLTYRCSISWHIQKNKRYKNEIKQRYTIQYQPRIFIHNAVFSRCMLFFSFQIKGKLIFRKIDITHLWQIVSSIAQKLNYLDFNNSNMCHKYSVLPSCENVIFKTFRLNKECSLTFSYVYILHR